MLITDYLGSGATGRSNSGRKGVEARTRDRIRALIAMDGPLTASELASRLALTSAAVRRHLDLLVEQGAIQEREPALAGGRGRPARAYILSNSGHAQMGNDYADLATTALDFLAAHAGADSVSSFVRQRNAELETRYATQLASVGADLQSRAQALATALSDDGFAATIRPAAVDLPVSGVHLCQGHCPVLHVATQFPEFCVAETEAFSRLLGVPVQRRTTLAQGEHVCMAFIPMDTIPMPAAGSLGTNQQDLPDQNEPQLTRRQ